MSRKMSRKANEYKTLNNIFIDCYKSQKIETRSSTYLSLVSDAGHQAGDGERVTVDVTMVEALSTHEPTQDPRIRCQSSDGDTGVVINRDDLLLVRAEVGRCSLQGDQDGVVLALDTEGSSTLGKRSVRGKIY